jgi:hypothetical protein
MKGPVEVNQQSHRSLKLVTSLNREVGDQFHSQT